MKVIIAGLLGSILCFGFIGCKTAHEAGQKTKHVVKKAGHAVGHATEETGGGISTAGQKLENKTQ